MISCLRHQALSTADVGIAIGSGSEYRSRHETRVLNTDGFSGDVAISSASFILVSSHLKGLLTLFDLSCTVFNRVKFNFVSRVHKPRLRENVLTLSFDSFGL